MSLRIVHVLLSLALAATLQAQTAGPATFHAPAPDESSKDNPRKGDGYFTAVIFSDPHVEQTGHDGAGVATCQDYCKAIINLGKPGGKSYRFETFPDYTPTADIVFCLGDMDKDNEKSGKQFKAAFHALNAAGIPFITMLGNHDAVPDYWTGPDADYGLTRSGTQSNRVAMALVTAQLDTAQQHGVTHVTRLTDGTPHTQFEPFTFTFRGVRFYCGQTYWFQKPYTGTFVNGKPLSAATGKLYAPDGVIKALEAFVDKHRKEPSVWMQHFPFTYGSDCDRWWLDQNDVGKYIKTCDPSAYGTDHDLGKWTDDATARRYAKKKKDKLAELIKRTKNGVHFSGHVHSFGDYTYDGVRDYTVAAPAISGGGMFLVLISEKEGVKEVKPIHLAPEYETEK